MRMTCQVQGGGGTGSKPEDQAPHGLGNSPPPRIGARALALTQPGGFAERRGRRCRPRGPGKPGKAPSPPRSTGSPGCARS